MRRKELAFPAELKKEKKGYSVSFPDFPEAHTQGDTSAEAFGMALDCLNAALEWRMEEKGDIPIASRIRKGLTLIPVSLSLAPKLALYEIMRELGISNVKLAKRLRVSEAVVRRMLNPKHKSKSEQYIRALSALGRATQVAVVELSEHTHV